MRHLSEQNRFSFLPGSAAIGLPQFLQGLPPSSSGWRRIWDRTVFTESPSLHAISAGDFPWSRISLMMVISCFVIQVIPPFEFAVLCVIALARCSPYGGRDVTGPWGYSPGNLCVFARKALCRCPQ